MNCWNQIGVEGDRSCPELEQYIHCRNCPVYASAGRSLLDREVPPGYLEEWTNVLRFHDSATRLSATVETRSFAIFRLEREWLAFEAQIIQEIREMTVIRTLPHRSDRVLLGLVNIRGEIQLCISLKAFLEIETARDDCPHISPFVYQRLVVSQKNGSRWVFPVDEIYGIHRIYSDELSNVPVTVAKASDTYTKSIIKWQDRPVSYLDDELLFYALDKKVLRSLNHE
jgi:chemotaxis-related protein WspD